MLKCYVWEGLLQARTKHSTCRFTLIKSQTSEKRCPDSAHRQRTCFTEHTHKHAALHTLLSHTTHTHMLREKRLEKNQSHDFTSAITLKTEFLALMKLIELLQVYSQIITVQTSETWTYDPQFHTKPAQYELISHARRSTDHNKSFTYGR